MNNGRMVTCELNQRVGLTEDYLVLHRRPSLVSGAAYKCNQRSETRVGDDACYSAAAVRPFHMLRLTEEWRNIERRGPDRLYNCNQL